MMEVDENLNFSIQQFDPMPMKRGETNISKRAPDYFL
jgi:hypothetical protein